MKVRPVGYIKGDREVTFMFNVEGLSESAWKLRAVAAFVQLMMLGMHARGEGDIGRSGTERVTS